MQLTAFGVLVKSIIVPIVVAEMLFAIRNSRARYYYRIILLVPLVVPGVVIWFIWKFIYEPNVGLLNSIFAVTGLDFLRFNRLGEPRTALFSIMVLGFPWVSGTAVLIYYAGLIGISESVLDAARLDGVTGLQRIRRIDIPLIRGQIKFFLVVGIIDSMVVGRFESQSVRPAGSSDGADSTRRITRARCGRRSAARLRAPSSSHASANWRLGQLAPRSTGRVRAPASSA